MKMYTFEQRLKAFFHDMRIIIGASMVNVVVLCVAFFSFCVPPQAKDLFNELVVQPGVAIWFWFALTFLSLALWYSSVITLAMHDLTDLDDSGNGMDHDKLIKTTPYFFGVGIYVIAFLGFQAEGVADNNLGYFFLGTGLLIYLFLRFIRQGIFRNKGLVHWVSKEPQSWADFHPMDKTIVLVVSGVLCVTMLFSLVISCNEIKPVQFPQFLGASSLITFYLSGVTIFFSVIWGLLKFKNAKISLSIVLLLFALGISKFNNNHHIRLMEEEEIVRVPVEENFKSWISERLDTAVYSEQHKFPVFLIAAEGGGIRAMNWSALVLDKLYQSDTTFYKHVYAISGVSGGSVGAVFHYAYQTEQGPGGTAKFQQALGKDFLSPVTFGLLFPEIAQALIPYPIHSWDRSRWLEDSWLTAYEGELGTDKLNLGLNEYARQYPAKLPNIFINCTALETGQKVVISNLKLSANYFENDIDLLTRLQEAHRKNPAIKTGMPLKTVASLSARFPLVTSAGKVVLDGSSFQIVDGGYHDNTGLETLNQIYNAILDGTPPALQSKLQVCFIYIRNSEFKSVESVKSADFLVDLNAPLNTLLNNWGRRPYSTIALTRNALYSFKHLGRSTNYFEFELDRAVFVDEATGARNYDSTGLKVLLPLGWQLSQVSKKEILRQVEAIADATRFERHKDPVAWRNYQSYVQLGKLLKNAPAQ